MPSAIARPFWMHQLVEYILGLALVSLGLQSPKPEVPAAMGLVVVVNAAIVRRAPLSAFRLVTKAQHRVLDLVVIALLVVATVQPWIEMVSADRITVGGVAVIMGFVWWRSSFVERAPRVAAPRPPVDVQSAPVTPAAPVVPAAPVATDRSTEIGRTAGRAVGQGLHRARRLTRRGRDT